MLSRLSTPLKEISLFSIPPSLSGVEDKMNWSMETKGEYKIATTYKLLTETTKRSSVYNFPWREYWRIRSLLNILCSHGDWSIG